MTTPREMTLRIQQQNHAEICRDGICSGTAIIRQSWSQGEGQRRNDKLAKKPVLRLAASCCACERENGWCARNRKTRAADPKRCRGSPSYRKAPEGRCPRVTPFLGQRESLVVRGRWRVAHTGLFFDAEHAPQRQARNFPYERRGGQSRGLCNCRSHSNRRLRRRFLSLSPLRTSQAGAMDVFRSPWPCDHRRCAQLLPQDRSSGNRTLACFCSSRSLMAETFLPPAPSNGRG